MHPDLILTLLVLTAVANSVPIFAKTLWGDRLAWPVDGGWRFFDGRPLFGRSKTLRGIVLAMLATPVTAVLLGYPAEIGLVVAAGAMAGDLLSSFIKRRLALPSSARATGLDQVPESLLPMVLCIPTLRPSLVDIMIGVTLFFVGEVLLSRLLYRWGLRDHPH